MRFVCGKDQVLKVNPEAVKALQLEYTKKVELTGAVEYENGDPLIQDMTTGFFDQVGVANCSVDQYSLTMVQKPDGTPIEKEKWENVFTFDVAAKQLEIKNYAGLPLEDFLEVRLMF